VDENIELEENDETNNEIVAGDEKEMVKENLVENSSGYNVKDDKKCQSKKNSEKLSKIIRKTRSVKNQMNEKPQKVEKTKKVETFKQITDKKSGNKKIKKQGKFSKGEKKLKSSSKKSNQKRSKSSGSKKGQKNNKRKNEL
jgi:hypothetical protein